MQDNSDINRAPKTHNLTRQGSDVVLCGKFERCRVNDSIFRLKGQRDRGFTPILDCSCTVLINQISAYGRTYLSVDWLLAAATSIPLRDVKFTTMIYKLLFVVLVVCCQCSDQVIMRKQGPNDNRPQRSLLQLVVLVH